MRAPRTTPARAYKKERSQGKTMRVFELVAVYEWWPPRDAELPEREFLGIFETAKEALEGAREFAAWLRNDPPDGWERRCRDFDGEWCYTTAPMSSSYMGYSRDIVVRLVARETLVEA